MGGAAFLVGLCVAFSALSTSGAAALPRRQAVDAEAMNEAIASSSEGGPRYPPASAYAHFLLAMDASLKGEPARAVEALRESLASDDGHPFLLAALAEQWIKLQKPLLAERELKRALELSPGYAPAQRLWGRLLYEGRYLAAARTHLLRAVTFDPGHADPYLLLAQIALERGRPEEAVERIEAMGRALPDEPLGFKRLGLALADRGEKERAEKMFRRALERDSGDGETWAALAQLLEAQGRIREADEALRQALRRDPENRELLLGGGRMALALRDRARARIHFDRLLLLSDEAEWTVKVALSYLSARELEESARVLDSARARPSQERKEPRIAFYAGLVHERMHDCAGAEKAYAEVAPASEVFHDARLYRAQCLSILGEHRQAIFLLRQELKDRPELPSIYSAYARALERSGDPDGAALFLNDSLERMPVAELFGALASLYQRRGQSRDAVELLQHAVAARPKDESLRFVLGAAYQREGEVQQSLEQMRQVLTINPQHAAAMNFIGYVLAETGRGAGDLQEAERLVNRALQLRPDSGTFLDSLGWVYFRRGDYSRAVDTLERAALLSPDEAQIIEHLGDAYQGAQDNDRAAEAYQRALEALAATVDANNSNDPPSFQETSRKRQGLLLKLKMLSKEL